MMYSQSSLYELGFVKGSNNEIVKNCESPTIEEEKAKSLDGIDMTIGFPAYQKLKKRIKVTELQRFQKLKK
ncbi:unnamed protein product [Moneuplotes crassus]|uniref:Uncharacterized protein n=1 Tax=Euplotes crassus TaxID=5936 RepID=A0AAD1UIK3_EUPCR|nr:unnamed protein product [Moneuplotes crassus]